MSEIHGRTSLYLVQHGEAVPETVDPERPLTAAGRSSVEQVATWAKRHGLQVDEIRHSGKLRAAQTAAILAAKLHPPRGVSVHPGLGPKDDVRPLARALATHSGSLMIVGHLPFLTRLSGFLLAGDSERALVDFRYAGLVGLTHDAEHWLISCVVPPQLTAPG
ncbi:phosphohistidine phosphatase SixA [Accumulibacter sp.]|uniref:phosphohistidine phosphatase SixA n=1 Tax=Accumulibacter sp. TaxID=2053492 RepID=UPI0025CDE002|nr:phosphohistidine phosphatase SixA [Accumulibacter sp.]MCM8596151.1 phosphohistidine phosphatase SixA [Accumulibacter sp.]MCM8625585.1 phosphohistidine phosphatase SixA [Accumulibacter sp.]MDS4050300.1 phosphohistidine phosphatase SixA [Accumulibacter sp.]